MSAILIYGFKVSVSLGVIYLFYQLALRNLTFYNWTRWFLLLGSGLCFVIPLVNVLPFLEGQEADNLRINWVISTLNTFSGPALYPGHTPNSYLENILKFIPVLFALGLFLQGMKLLIQFISFFQILRSATCLPEGDIKIYQVDKNIAPFSFGNALFLNKKLHQPAELQAIIKHELVHINQKHTIDVLWMEFLCLVNWFNPLVWLLKRVVRQNLEFIADREVLMTPDLDKKYYQYLILKVIGSPDFKIANQFNISSLKTRIKMMNRTPSSRHELIKFLFILPLLALLLLACQDNAPEIPPPPPPVVLKEDTEHKLFRQSNPQVDVLGWQENNTMVLFLKSGEREEYNLNNRESRAAAEKKYGKLPPGPPPPPPVTLDSAK